MTASPRPGTIPPRPHKPLHLKELNITEFLGLPVEYWQGMHNIILAAGVSDLRELAIRLGTHPKQSDPEGAPFSVGQSVTKASGYRFVGIVKAIWWEVESQDWRLVVRNADGLMHIFNPTQMKAA